MNYYQRHLGDYARDTGHLTLLEHGVYGALLDWQYGTEKPLPEEETAVHRICRALSKAEKNAADRIKKEFFGESGWNKRCKAELKKCALAAWQKKRGALIKHHPELANLSDVQLQEWCISSGYAEDMQCRRTTTRARSKTPLLQDAKTPVLGGGERPLPELVSDEAIMQFGKSFPGEPASGAPGPMDPHWVLDFIRKINGRNTFPANWQRLMTSSWRVEFRSWKPSQSGQKTGGYPEKNGEKMAAVSPSVRVIELRNELRQLEAADAAERASDLLPDTSRREKIAEIRAELTRLEGGK